MVRHLNIIELQVGKKHLFVFKSLFNSLAQNISAMFSRIKNPIVIHYNSKIFIAAIRALALALNDDAGWIRVKKLLPAPAVKF